MGKSLEFLELDFNDPREAIMAITFSSVDFRELGKSKGSYSKTLIMPSTKRNDLFFGMSFDASAEGFFDPLIKVPIQISEIEFYGSLQLNSVNVLNGKPQSYSVNIFGDLGSWASLIGEGSIKDLKHHESHVLSAQSIEGSWSNTGLRDDYVYPIISYGNYLQDVGTLFNIEIAFWRPAFFVLPLVRQIFKEAGYTFIDKGLVNTPLVNAILPFTSKEVALDDVRVNASNDSSNTYHLFISAIAPHNTTTVFNEGINFNNEERDNINIFDNTIARYVVPSTGDLEITINVNDVLATTQPSGGLGSGSLSMHISAFNVTSGNSAAITNNVFISRIKDTTFSLSGTKTISQSEGNILEFRAVLIADGRVEMGAVRIKNADITIIPKASLLGDGAVLDHADVIQDVRKIDLVRDVIKRGNFRILTDNQKKTVEFIQEANFLQAEPENWDNKVDQSSPASISLIQNQGAKELTWSHDNDNSDGFIKDREDKNNISLGQRKVELESEYRKGSQDVYTSVFSATIDGTGLGGVPLPVMSTQELKQGEPVEIGEYETNFRNRILIYEGLQAGSFLLDGVIKGRYPKSSFVGEEFSLGFDDDPATGVIGLVSRYYKNAIKRLNKSRLYSGLFFLTELDISRLNFRTPKIIKGIHYYLNTVIDYKVNANQPTKVELISR